VPGTDGFWLETAAPGRLPAGEVVVLQPYGSLFFAAAPSFETALPVPSDDSRGSVVILRLRGRTDLGTTFLAVLSRYAENLAGVGSKLVIVSTGDRVEEQLRLSGVTATVGPENVYPSDDRVGAALAEAYADASAWVAERRAAARRP
jgi:SulP family sulfate permease